MIKQCIWGVPMIGHADVESMETKAARNAGSQVAHSSGERRSERCRQKQPETKGPPAAESPKAVRHQGANHAIQQDQGPWHRIENPTNGWFPRRGSSKSSNISNSMSNLLKPSGLRVPHQKLGDTHFSLVFLYQVVSSMRWFISPMHWFDIASDLAWKLPRWPSGYSLESIHTILID